MTLYSSKTTRMTREINANEDFHKVIARLFCKKSYSKEIV